jgi:hypothetical protein
MLSISNMHHSSATAKGQFTIATYKAGTDIVLRKTEVIDNLILTAGLSQIPLQHLGNGQNLEITSLEIGDGDTAVTVSDTELDNMIVDGVPRANQSAAGLTVNLSFFIPDIDLPNGEYKELGLRTSSDILYTRALIVPTFTKSSSEDTRVDYQLSYSAV